MTTQPRAATPRWITMATALGGAALAWTSLALAHEPDATPKGAEGVVIIELQTGAVHGSHPAVKVIRQPRDANKDGYFEAGVQIDLSQYSRLSIEAEYGDAVPEGITLNLGDSRTNNGLVRHAKGHTAHIHVRFKCSARETKCIE